MPSDLNFDAEAFQKLPVADRVQLCRHLAERAQALADGAAPNHRDTYAEIARQWLMLAADMEREGA